MSVISALEAVQAALRSSGSTNQTGNDWTCPTHDDHEASLTVKYGQPGKVILSCGASCKPKTILTRIGLKWPDLFDDSSKAKDKVVGRNKYTYKDEDGARLFFVRRTTLESGAKRFTQQGVGQKNMD